MILKDAFRYQNYYDKLIDKATGHLVLENNITQKKQEHLRNKANPDAENEITIEKADVFENENITPMHVVSFLMNIVEEKEKLTNAIAVAKSNAKINIDASIEINKVRQTVSNVFQYMSTLKSSERKTMGKSVMLNADKNQVAYAYDIIEVKTIDYDRNTVKALMKKLNAQSDKISADIDMANITTEVNYTPAYDIDDSFEDCIVKCCGI